MGGGSCADPGVLDERQPAGGPSISGPKGWSMMNALAGGRPPLPISSGDCLKNSFRRAAGKRESCAVLMSPPVTPSAWASSTEMVKVDQDPVGPHGVSGRESVLVDLSHAAWCG